MLNMGFVEQIETIIKSLSKEPVTMLLSATMPKDIETLCNKYMKDPIYIEIEEQNKAVDNICQERYNINELNKILLFLR